MDTAPIAKIGWAGRSGPELCAGSFAICWFFYLGYGPTLDPTHFEWMLRNDWAAYLWGFAFFRNASWTWPLGSTPNLFWPQGTSVGFTDANPWVSVICKLLSGILPQDFQFCGLWFLACFVLQALVGTRVGRVLSEDKIRQALIGCIFAATPLLPSRSPHIALCALFFVSAGVYLNLKPVATREDGIRILKRAALLLGWAAGTHGYLTVMLLALILACCVRLVMVERVLRAREAWVAVGGFAALLLGIFIAFGYLGWKKVELTEEGFGQFSSDLTALVNAAQWSRLIDGFPVRPRQWEGFAYLGLGVLALLALHCAARVRSWASALRPLQKQLPLVSIALLMWVYSLSSRVTFRGQTVLDLDPLYEPLARLTGIFRSSGRFAWPLHIVLVTAAVAFPAAWKRAQAGRVALLVALLIQVGEFDPSPLNFRDVSLDPLRHPAWAASRHDYAHLALVPLQLMWVCRYNPATVNRLSYEAYRRGWTFNSGNFMRKEPDSKRLCRERSAPRPDTIYVVSPRIAQEFRHVNFRCGTLEGLLVCVSEARPTPLLAALAGS